MKLSHIEVTVPIGRTERGQTITVMDLLKAFSIATGTEIGSMEFDRALEDPSQLHARETIENASRFRSLRALAQRAFESGPISLGRSGECTLQTITADAQQIGAERNRIQILIQLENGLDDGLGLDKAIDAFNSVQNPS